MSQPLVIPMPGPQKANLRRAAARQGLTLAALGRRLFFMYLTDPQAYENLYLELTKANKVEPGPGVSNQAGRVAP